MSITFESVLRAREAQDPDLPELLSGLVNTDPRPELPIPEGAKTFDQFRSYLHSSYRWSPIESREQIRKEWWSALEAPDAYPLPDRLKLHKVVLDLWKDNGVYARSSLLRIIQTVPITWGPWRGIKKIFKEAEAIGDNEIYFAIAARLDQLISTYGARGEVSQGTLGYMVRRAWRYLRKLGQSLPSAYPDAAVELLRHYDDDTNWHRTWIFNHICFHEGHQYGVGGFRMYYLPDDLLEKRAFAELWQRSPRPLFRLLELAKGEKPRLFAVSALKKDFRAVLREVEPEWVRRLVGVGSNTVDEFVVWILKTVPRFEQSAFKQLGLHDSVLRLLQSESREAQEYSAAYVRTHARDLDIEYLIMLANSESKVVRKLARDLLQERNPRTEVGLEAWGHLLGTTYSHDLAEKTIRNHFSARELTPEWLKERVLSDNSQVYKFAINMLKQLYSFNTLGESYFISLFNDERINEDISVDLLKDFLESSIKQLSTDFLKKLIIHPHTSEVIQEWVDDNKLQVSLFGIEFVKQIATSVEWKKSSWVENIKKEEIWWVNELEFNHDLSYYAQEWLQSAFSPSEIGHEWLLSLLGHPDYSHFASNYLNRYMNPSDFGGSLKAGFDFLWKNLTEEGDAEEALPAFAREYLKLHHPDLGFNLTGSKLSPEKAIPSDFFSFKVMRPLFFDSRSIIREFAIEISRWEMARWQPSLFDLIEICELPYDDVTDFMSEILMADPEPKSERYRLDPEGFTPDAVYSYCDSMDESTRELGMKLIAKHSRLALPKELFRLTESPDKQMQAFAIRTFWNLYRSREITENWKPKALPERLKVPELGPGAPSKPEQAPAQAVAMAELLVEILYSLPPGRSKSTRKRTMKPLPQRLAKIQLVEVMRDLALEDKELAEIVVPLMAAFMPTRGRSEQAACLVALARIGACHPHLDVLQEA